MVKRQESGEWSLSDADLRRLAVIVSLAGGLFTAGVAWAAASMKTEQVERRVTITEVKLEGMENVPSDVRIIKRLLCRQFESDSYCHAEGMK